MVRQVHNRQTLPYTTAYGRNWQPWMVLRELESNTRDENGSSHIIEDEGDRTAIAGMTRTLVDCEAIEAAYLLKDEIFHPTAARSGSGLEILPGPGTYIYWRGVRVFKTTEKTLKTYNILDSVQLTEDRTLDGEWRVREMIAQSITLLDDADLIQELITVDEDYWEHHLEPSRWTKPSATFMMAVESTTRPIAPAMRMHFARHDSRPKEERLDLLGLHPMPWRFLDDEIVDKFGRSIVRMPYNYPMRWDPVAEALLKMVGNMKPVDDPCDDDQSKQSVGSVDTSTDPTEIPF